MANHWLLLAIAIALEVCGTLLLKQSHGFARWQLGVTAIGFYVLCFWVFATALRSIPVGVAYAIWAGAGIVMIAAIGHAVFDEKLGLTQLFFMSLVVIGIVGLRLATPQ
jgi:small multidrug resistance pump